MKKRKNGFEAATDNPVEIAARAIAEAKRAFRERDDLGVRQAANKAWLAASSAADVAAKNMGRKAPGGATGRKDVLEDLEKLARMKNGTLLNAFANARLALHGECFHGDSCPSSHELFGMLDAVQKMTHEAVVASASTRVQRAIRARRR